MSVIKTEKLSLILSQYAGISEEEASRFLSVFASVISEHVRNGEDVEIQGLGRFIVIDTKQSEMRRVALILSEIMRDEVNSPFSFFEPYVINKGKEIPSEELLNDESSSSIIVIEEDPLETSDTANNSELDNEQSLDTDQTVSANIDETETLDADSEAISIETDSVLSSIESTEDDNSDKETLEQKNKNVLQSHKLLYLSIFIVLILAVIIYYFNRSSVQEIEANEEITALADSLCENTDTLSNQVFVENLLLDSLGFPVKIIANESDRLTSLSQRLLGSSDFWPYFYEVNKEVISSTSSELTGLELFVPNKSFYDIDASNHQSIEKAKALGIEIIKN